MFSESQQLTLFESSCFILHFKLTLWGKVLAIHKVFSPSSNNLNRYCISEIDLFCSETILFQLVVEFDHKTLIIKPIIAGAINDSFFSPFDYH
jgi:hypothetical protein